ncbi:MAG: hypothetical protein ACP5VX_04215 [Thermogladius sp.]
MMRRNPRYDRWVELVELKFDEAFTELGIRVETVYEKLLESVLEGLDYVLVCGSCSEWEYCVVSSITFQGDYFEVGMRGARVSVSEQHPFDKLVERLFALSRTIVKKGGRVYFYLTPEFAKPARLMLCGDREPSDIRVEGALFEEREFIEGGRE